MDFSARNSVKVGENKNGVFDFAGKKVSFFKLKVGPNKFNIIPFTASENNPLVKAKVMKKGQPDYGLILKVHKYIGINQDTYVCPSTYGKQCPICEASQKAYSNNDSATGKALKAKEMVYYNVVDPVDTDKGVQLFEFNSYEFERVLKAVDNSARVDPDEENYEHFADPSKEKGRYVKIEATEEPTPKGKPRAKPVSITFGKRREDTTEYLAKVIQLDDCVKVLSYDELECVLTGGGDPVEEEADEPEEKPAKKAPPVEEEEVPPKKEVKADGCPNGHKFGKDWGECKECDACFDDDPATYKACRKASRE